MTDLHTFNVGGEALASSANGEQPQIVPPLVQPPNVVTFPETISTSERPSYDDIKRRRDQAMQGVPFQLLHDDYPAIVRLLNLAEKTAVLALPTKTQELFLRVMKDRNIPADKKWRNMAEWEAEATRNETAVNQICVMGFVKPRLVMTEAERDPNDPDCWPVDMVHQSDRIRYFFLVTGVDTGEMDRIRRFLREGVAGT